MWWTVSALVYTGQAAFIEEVVIGRCSYYPLTPDEWYRWLGPLTVCDTLVLAESRQQTQPEGFHYGALLTNESQNYDWENRAPRQGRETLIALSDYLRCGGREGEELTWAEVQANITYHPNMTIQEVHVPRSFMRAWPEEDRHELEIRSRPDTEEYKGMRRPVVKWIWI